MQNEIKNPIGLEVEADTGDVEVELVTAQNKKITRVDVPPFIDMPHVVVWGDRFFRLTDDETDDGCYVYMECFAYVVTSAMADFDRSKVARWKTKKDVVYGERTTGGQDHGDKKKLECLHCGKTYNGGEYRPATITVLSETFYDRDGNALATNRINSEPETIEACPHEGCDGSVFADGMPVENKQE
ncbi:MAG: hypothetical protein GY841_15720 [FCB group bacterium]|nr:hypothetical protein [FCB group bacterium]